MNYLPDSPSFRPHPPLEDSCLSGTLVPHSDTQIFYTKQVGNPLTIALQGGGEIQDGKNTLDFIGQIGLFSDPSCGELKLQKLPVWGPGQVGDTFTVRQDGVGPVLLKGSLSVFGRTLDLGWFGEGGAIYAATSQPMALPPGGWVRTDGASSHTNGSASFEDAALFGFLSLTDQGLSLSLSTEAPLLQMVAPGGRLEPNRVEIGMFAQILNDPNILRLQLVILIFFFLLPVVTDLVGLALSGRER